MIAGFLEAVDTKSGMVQYLAVPEPRFHSYHAKWLHRISKVILCALSLIKFCTSKVRKFLFFSPILFVCFRCPFT